MQYTVTLLNWQYEIQYEITPPGMRLLLRVCLRGCARRMMPMQYQLACRYTRGHLDRADVSADVTAGEVEQHLLVVLVYSEPMRSITAVFI
jgi:hypothetical protein